MAAERVYNFSSGPAVLPLQVLETAASELVNYGGTGMSVMEMSHRGKDYLAIFNDVKSRLKCVLNVPDSHEILFMQGGATFQFSAVPLNLIGTSPADYAVTGNFASIAAKEAAKYGTVHTAASSGDKRYAYIPSQNELNLTDGASYFYYCSNNTIYGTEWKYVPETKAPLVCDMSSNILSKPIDVSKYGLIFAGVQKNMAPAGMAVVILDKTLAGKEKPFTPKIMSYQTAIDSDSMSNTPPCYTIYMLGLMLKWVEEQGGLSAMEVKKTEKAKLLYDFLDDSKFFAPIADKEARSDMNVTFRTPNAETDADFVKEAAQNGLVTLAGHRTAGGLRASVYNAMPYEGVEKLVNFMKEYELRHV